MQFPLTGSALAALGERAGLPNAQIHVVGLPAGAPAWVADDGRWIYPASMIKVPLAVAIAADVAAGRLRWDGPVTIDAANLTPNDAPSPFQPGYVATVDELVTFMLQRSDNVATNQLYDVTGRVHATEAIRALGYAQTAFRRKLSGADPLIADAAATGRNSFPAREAAALFAAIARDAVPGAARLRGIMATSWWDVKLSLGLAEGDRFAHKTGDTSATSHDGGILTLAGGARWVVVVYTELPGGGENDERFGAFMRALRPHLEAASTSRPWSTG